MASLVLLNIVGGVCLLLWGLRTVRNGMTRAFGADLHSFVSASTGNRITAFFSGIGVTALLQSSTATALIIAAFCGQGILSLKGGIAVMLGADVGTTIVAQALSYNLSWVAPALVVFGYIIHDIYKKSGKWGHIGKLFIGLGLMLFALMWIKQSAVPLKESETLALVIKSLAGDPIFAVLIVAVITWVAHSSLAIVLLLMSFVVSGVLPVGLGLAMVLGANLGGALVPVVVTFKDSREAARVPMANFILRLLAVIVAYPFMDDIYALLSSWGSPDERMLVDFHLAFNVGLALVAMPFIGPIAKIIEKMMPSQKDPDDPNLPRYLDNKELDSPSVALSAVMRETLRMADVLQRMLEDTITALRNDDPQLVKEIRKRDNVIDHLYTASKIYMAKMTQESLDPEEAQYYMQILSFSSNIENAGDTIDKSLMDMADKKIRDKLKFSQKGWEDIQKIHEFVLASVRKAQSVFVSEDPLLARQLLEAKEELRVLEQAATQSHLARIREGVPETIATSSLHLDIIRDYRRINSYMCSVAYPILEGAGQLRSTRLRKLKKHEEKSKEQSKDK